MTPKPKTCNGCPLYYTKEKTKTYQIAASTGFIDPKYHTFEDIQLVLVCDKPYKEDILSGIPLDTPFGYMLEKKYLNKLGITRKNVYVSYMLRCYTYLYPIGEIKKKAERQCRQYDDYAIRKWQPDSYLITFSFSDVLKTPTLYRSVLTSMEKAVKLKEEGNKPVVLMGANALSYFVPQYKKGPKTWQGSFLSA